MGVLAESSYVQDFSKPSLFINARWARCLWERIESERVSICLRNRLPFKHTSLPQPNPPSQPSRPPPQSPITRIAKDVNIPRPQAPGRSRSNKAVSALPSLLRNIVDDMNEMPKIRSFVRPNLLIRNPFHFSAPHYSHHKANGSELYNPSATKPPPLPWFPAPATSYRAKLHPNDCRVWI